MLDITIFYHPNQWKFKVGSMMDSFPINHLTENSSLTAVIYLHHVVKAGKYKWSAQQNSYQHFPKEGSNKLCQDTAVLATVLLYQTDGLSWIFIFLSTLQIEIHFQMCAILCKILE